MPLSKTCMSWLGRPRMKTDVNWPAVPVCTTDNPGTSRSASLTRSICFCSRSSDVITLTLAGDCSSGISKRVAETTTGSDSAVFSWSVDVDVTASCARSEHAALTKLNTTNHIGRFRIQVSSNSESRTCMAEAASPSSHSSFCEEVFSRTAHAGTNEADRTNILAPGFWSGSRRTHLLPAFTVFLWRQPDRLHKPRAASDTA